MINIFYSWQSDLPNNSNRSFIEKCILQSIKESSNVAELSLELCLDRDTKNEPGTPDIAASIFSKIEQAKIFIADVSIINHNEKAKKTPNPNVLMEVGYASRALGWKKIICIYNRDYGTYEDLPFNLRSRRPLSYSIKNDGMEKAKRIVCSAINDTVANLYKKGELSNTIDDYLKVQIDTQILTIVEHFRKIFYGYNKTYWFQGVQQFLSLDYKDIFDIIKNGKYIGFQLLKKHEYVEKELVAILAQTSISTSFTKDKTLPVVELIKWIGVFDSFATKRTAGDLYTECSEHNVDYTVETSLNRLSENHNYPERCLLLKKLENDTAEVQDFGDFAKYTRDKLLKTYKINEKYSLNYSYLVHEFIRIANKWLDATGGEFILDNVRNFKMIP